MPKKYKRKTSRPYVNSKPVSPQAVAFRPGFISDLDARTSLAKELRARRAQIVDETGGEAQLSRVKAALIDRFVHLECLLESWEREMYAGNTESAAKWTQGVNALSGLATKLGLNKTAVAMPWLDGGTANGGGKVSRDCLPSRSYDGTADQAAELEDK